MEECEMLLRQLGKDKIKFAFERFGADVVNFKFT